MIGIKTEQQEVLTVPSTRDQWSPGFQSSRGSDFQNTACEEGRSEVECGQGYFVDIKGENSNTCLQKLNYSETSLKSPSITSIEPETVENISDSYSSIFSSYCSVVYDSVVNQLSDFYDYWYDEDSKEVVNSSQISVQQNTLEIVEGETKKEQILTLGQEKEEPIQKKKQQQFVQQNVPQQRLTLKEEETDDDVGVIEEGSEVVDPGKVLTNGQPSVDNKRSEKESVLIQDRPIQKIDVKGQPINDTDDRDIGGNSSIIIEPEKKIKRPKIELEQNEEKSELALKPCSREDREPDPTKKQSSKESKEEILILENSLPQKIKVDKELNVQSNLNLKLDNMQSVDVKPQLKVIQVVSSDPKKNALAFKNDIKLELEAKSETEKLIRPLKTQTQIYHLKQQENRYKNLFEPSKKEKCKTFFKSMARLALRVCAYMPTLGGVIANLAISKINENSNTDNLVNQSPRNLKQDVKLFKAQQREKITTVIMRQQKQDIAVKTLNKTLSELKGLREEYSSLPQVVDLNLKLNLKNIINDKVKAINELVKNHDLYIDNKKRKEYGLGANESVIMGSNSSKEENDRARMRATIFSTDNLLCRKEQKKLALKKNKKETATLTLNNELAKLVDLKEQLKTNKQKLVKQVIIREIEQSYRKIKSIIKQHAIQIGPELNGLIDSMPNMILKYERAKLVDLKKQFENTVLLSVYDAIKKEMKESYNEVNFLLEQQGVKIDSDFKNLMVSIARVLDISPQTKNSSIKRYLPFVKPTRVIEPVLKESSQIKNGNKTTNKCFSAYHKHDEAVKENQGKIDTDKELYVTPAYKASKGFAIGEYLFSCMGGGYSLYNELEKDNQCTQLKIESAKLLQQLNEKREIRDLLLLETENDQQQYNTLTREIQNLELKIQSLENNLTILEQQKKDGWSRSVMAVTTGRGAMGVVVNSIALENLFNNKSLAVADNCSIVGNFVLAPLGAVINSYKSYQGIKDIGKTWIQSDLFKRMLDDPESLRLNLDHINLMDGKVKNTNYIMKGLKLGGDIAHTVIYTCTTLAALGVITGGWGLAAAAAVFTAYNLAVYIGGKIKTHYENKKQISDQKAVLNMRMEPINLEHGKLSDLEKHTTAVVENNPAISFYNQVEKYHEIEQMIAQCNESLQLLEEVNKNTPKNTLAYTETVMAKQLMQQTLLDLRKDKKAQELFWENLGISEKSYRQISDLDLETIEGINHVESIVDSMVVSVK